MKIKQFFKDYHWTAIVETLVILIFTVLPTIAGVFAGIINSETILYSKFYKSGEILLYSVSLLSGAYLVYNKFKVRASDWRRLLSMIIMIALLILALLYALIIVSPRPNLPVIKYISFSFFIIATALFYHSQLLSNKPTPDIGAQRNEESNNIANALT
ncbi:MAG: hypothetical protein H0U95_18865 [Bacteroidetes bacterium]|nr:hypothetical protein [Bacteroidota bacterium]